TRRISIVVEPVIIPNDFAWCTRSATLALQISFLLGRQLMFGHDPPIHFRSTTAVRCPVLARCQLSSLPPAPLPRTRASYRSVEVIMTRKNKQESRPALMPAVPHLSPGYRWVSADGWAGCRASGTPSVVGHRHVNPSPRPVV